MKKKCFEYFCAVGCLILLLILSYGVSASASNGVYYKGSYANSSLWSQITGGSYSGTPISISAYNGSMYLATSSGIYYKTSYESMYTWTLVTGGSYAGIPISINASNKGIFLLTSSGMYYKLAMSSSYSWTAITGGGYSGIPTSISSYGSSIYLATSSGVYYKGSYSSSTAWSAVTGGSYLGTPISIGIYNGGIYLVTSSGVYFKTSYSSSTLWSQVTGGSYTGIPAGICPYNGAIYLATSSGVYYKASTLESNVWTQVAGGSYSYIPISIGVYSGHIYLATTSAPTAFTLSATSGQVRQATITWTNSAEAFYYELFRNGVSLGNKTSPFIDTGLEDGATYNYYVVAKNVVGNTQSNSVSATTYLDTTAPTGSFVINNNSQYTNSKQFTLKFSISDGSMPLNEVSIYISDQDTAPSGASSDWQSYSETKSFIYDGTDGDVTLYTWFKDKVGNISSVKSDSITFDKTPPTGTLIIEDGNPTTKSTVALNFTKTFEWANVKQIVISNNSNFSDSVSVSYADIINSWSFSDITFSGEQSVYAKYLDWAGNYSDPFSASIQYTPEVPVYDVVEKNRSIIGYVDEKIIGFDGYTLLEKYERGNDLFILFKSSTGIKVVGWQGNIICEKTIGNGFTYIGLANGYIVYKYGSSYYRDSVKINSPQVICTAVSGHTPQLTPEGLFVQTYYTKAKKNTTISSIYNMNYYVKAWDINTNTQLYDTSGTFDSMMSVDSEDINEIGLSIAADGWIVYMNNFESYKSNSGNAYFFSKYGVLHGPYNWNSSSYGWEDSLSIPQGVIVRDYDDDNIIEYYTEAVQTDYSWTEESSWGANTNWWKGALDYQLIKLRGTGAGSIYTVSDLSTYRDDSKVLYDDNDYILATLGRQMSSTYLGTFALLHADHTNKTLTPVWTRPFQDYPMFSAAVDKENGLVYVYAKLSMTSQVNTDVWVLDFNTGKMIQYGKLDNSTIKGILYYAKDKNVYYADNNVIYRRKFTTSDSVSSDAKSTNVYTVIKDKEFNIFVKGEYSGEFNQEGIGNVVAGASGEEGVTTLTGTLTFTSTGTKKFKILKITIGEDVFYFRVVLPPSSTTTTTVRFQ